MSAAAEVFDLSTPETYELVRRVYFARFAARVRQAGIDPEDGLQTVFEVLLRRQQSPTSRWNPARGGPSTYVYVVAGSVVANLLDSRRRADARDGTVGVGADISAYRNLPAPEEPGVLHWRELAEQRGLTVEALADLTRGKGRRRRG